jgi:hypothetical protein
VLLPLLLMLLPLLNAPLLLPQLLLVLLLLANVPLLLSLVLLVPPLLPPVLLLQMMWCDSTLLISTSSSSSTLLALGARQSAVNCSSSEFQSSGDGRVRPHVRHHGWKTEAAATGSVRNCAGGECQQV